MRLRQRADGDKQAIVSVLVMPGRGNVVLILLAAAFEGKKVIIAASPFARVVPARGRSCLVNGTVAIAAVEKPANAAEVLVRLAPYDSLVPMVFSTEFGLRLFRRQGQVPGNSFDIPLGDGNNRIGAAVTGAFRAIVGGFCHWGLLV